MATASFLPPIYSRHSYPTEIGYGGGGGDMQAGTVSPGLGGRFGTMTPTQGLRPQSQMYRPMSRTGSRAGSRLEMGTQLMYQTEPRVDMFTPQMVRPALERGATFSGVEPEMDPFTKNYYHRVWRSSVPSTSFQMNRMGRAGGKWRHITSCIANTGSHVTFVEGTVKQVDNAITGPLPVTTAQPKPRPVNAPRNISFNASKKRAKLDTQFNDRAKNNFKYWYQEQKPIDLSHLPGLKDPRTVASRLRLKARAVGLGY